MGSHDEHLPRRDLNKAVSPVNPLNGKTASARRLSEVAHGQGEGTKTDAKAAKAKKKG